MGKELNKDNQIGVKGLTYEHSQCAKLITRKMKHLKITSDTD